MTEPRDIEERPPLLEPSEDGLGLSREAEEAGYRLIEPALPPGYRIFGPPLARYGAIEGPLMRVISPLNDGGWTWAEAAKHCRDHAEAAKP